MKKYIMMHTSTKKQNIYSYTITYTPHLQFHTWHKITHLSPRKTNTYTYTCNFTCTNWHHPHINMQIYLLYMCNLHTNTIYHELQIGVTYIQIRIYFNITLHIRDIHISPAPTTQYLTHKMHIYKCTTQTKKRKTLMSRK